MTDATTLTPKVFNERFTVYLNTDGKPVERTLREMTADEVLAALDWFRAEARRLAPERQKAEQIARAIENGRDENLNRGEVKAAAAILREAGNLELKEARLLALIHVSMPQWHKHKGMGLGEALHRFWSTGSTAA